jgi:molybdopterin-guanine dinucleotide biosynthesis protein A
LEDDVTPSVPKWDAIVVAGGRASRLGGIDKTALVYEGRSLLRRSLDAVRRAERVSVVRADTLRASTRVRLTEEVPRFGGPAAAISAGLANLLDSRSEFIAVIAADLPQVAVALRVLLGDLQNDPVGDGVVAVDSDGKLQPLLAIYRTVSLRSCVAMQPSVAGLSVRALISSLTVRSVRLPDRLCADVDTPLDADALGIIVPVSA